jgi:hypothetical protein
MSFHENFRHGEAARIGSGAKISKIEYLGHGRAAVTVSVKSPRDWKKALGATRDRVLRALKAGKEFAFKRGENGSLWLADMRSYALIGDPETVYNQITNAGRDFLHQQGYQTSGLGANGLNYIALTNTAITPAAGDTTLSGEITSNGLGRAQGTVAHSAGTNTTTVDHTFTCATSSQACQATALFTAASSGTMNHELTFTQRTLQVGDTIDLTFTISLG